jgi:hypothetical protein
LGGLFWITLKMREIVETDNERLIGLESELMLVDGPGRVFPGADDVLDQSDSEYITQECTPTVIEVGGPPSSSLDELAMGFMAELRQLDAIVESLGLRAIPASEFGPGQASIMRHDYLRYIFNNLVLGEERDSVARSLCGTHLHLDRETRVLDQYNVLESIDLAFVFLSSSSYLKGTNTLNCNRVNSYRNYVFGGDLKDYGQLLNYAESLDQLKQLGRTRLSIWKQMINDERADGCYDEYNACWGPIRLRKKTIEVRNADANLFSLVMAMAALYKGVNNYVFDKNLGVEIAVPGQTYGITDSEITLPSYRDLKQMESEGIKDGLGSDNVFKYLSYLVDVAENGLPHHERKYLAPFKTMLKLRKNVADLIYVAAKGFDPSVNGSISPETAQMVSLYMDGLNKKDRTHPFTGLFPAALERAEHSLTSR